MLEISGLKGEAETLPFFKMDCSSAGQNLALLQARNDFKEVLLDAEMREDPKSTHIGSRSRPDVVRHSGSNDAAAARNE